MLLYTLTSVLFNLLTFPTRRSSYLAAYCFWLVSVTTSHPAKDREEFRRLNCGLPLPTAGSSSRSSRFVSRSGQICRSLALAMGVRRRGWRRFAEHNRHLDCSIG